MSLRRSPILYESDFSLGARPFLPLISFPLQRSYLRDTEVTLSNVPLNAHLAGGQRGNEEPRAEPTARLARPQLHPPGRERYFKALKYFIAI